MKASEVAAAMWLKPTSLSLPETTYLFTQRFFLLTHSLIQLIFCFFYKH